MTVSIGIILLLGFILITSVAIHKVLTQLRNHLVHIENTLLTIKTTVQLMHQEPDMSTKGDPYETKRI